MTGGVDLAVGTGTVGLGLDAGGTSTRWALADPTGRVLAQGGVAGLTALMMGSESGRAQTEATLVQLAHDARDTGLLRPAQPRLRILAGFTAYSDNAPLRAALERMIARIFELPQQQVRVVGDVALAYLDCFAPGAGHLVYAGTGSVAATIDQHGQMYRAGGRGGLLDDGGSGYWIAREAMRHIWRTEDEQPGSWRASGLAIAVFERVGGSEWSRSRDFFYQGTRGQVGELALAVAAAANSGERVAREILRQAGIELARLARALTQRFGERPVALAGRAAQLHPAIEQHMREALGATTDLRVVSLRAHETAARLAARDDPLLDSLSDTEPPPVPPTTGDP